MENNIVVVSDGAIFCLCEISKYNHYVRKNAYPSVADYTDDLINEEIQNIKNKTWLVFGENRSDGRVPCRIITFTKCKYKAVVSRSETDKGFMFIVHAVLPAGFPVPRSLLRKANLYLRESKLYSTKQKSILERKNALHLERCRKISLDSLYERRRRRLMRERYLERLERIMRLRKRYRA